jgi:hypothetical protein
LFLSLPEFCPRLRGSGLLNALARHFSEVLGVNGPLARRFWTPCCLMVRLSCVFRFFFVVPSVSFVILDFFGLHRAPRARFQIFIRFTVRLIRISGFFKLSQVACPIFLDFFCPFSTLYRRFAIFSGSTVRVELLRFAGLPPLADLLCESTSRSPVLLHNSLFCRFFPVALRSCLSRSVAD